MTSYKIALLRAINDVVMSFPDLAPFKKDVAIPLRTLARFWLAYYWPFFDDGEMILQGPRAKRGGKLTNDMAFRSQLAGRNLTQEECKRYLYWKPFDPEYKTCPQWPSPAELEATQ